MSDPVNPEPVENNNTNEEDPVATSAPLDTAPEPAPAPIPDLHITDHDNIINLAENEDLEGDLKEIYDLVKAKIRQIIATGKFTADHLRPLILNIVEIVQEYTKDKYAHIDGAQKKAMALNILRHVIVDIHKDGQISQEQYELILLSLEFFGGALIDLGKAAWKALVNVVGDVSDNGCAGCFGRNCRNRN